MDDTIAERLLMRMNEDHQCDPLSTITAAAAAAVIQDEEDDDDVVVAAHRHPIPGASSCSGNDNAVLGSTKLRTLLNLSDPNDVAAVSLFLSSVGCKTVEDLAFVEKEDFAAQSSSKNLLPLTTQRKLLLVTEYLRLAGSDKTLASVDCLATMMEQVRHRASCSSLSTSTKRSIRHQDKSTIRDDASSEEQEAVIGLDVGGHKFTTTRTTLCRVKGSVLEAMFSGRHENSALRNTNGEYVIDRDGTHFGFILAFLRVGAVVSLPEEKQARDALAVEADFYVLEDLVRAINRPIIDIDDFIPEEVRKIRADEEKIRTAFACENRGANVDPHRGLIPLFHPESGLDAEIPLKFEPFSDITAKKLCPVLGARKSPGEPGTPVTVSSLDQFRHFFNRDHSEVLHRLNDVLLEEPVIIAGGSVLRALTAGQDVRTHLYWPGGGVGDVDIFIHTKDRAEANRIARRIFYSLAVDLERWVIVRSKGVINIFRFVGGRWDSHTDQKIQIILRLYESPAEVLYGFDCDSCCCAYDGKEVWVTPRWTYALRHGVNVLNPLHSWPNKASYELRLAKYAYRGFAVLVPGLDRSRVDHNFIHTKHLDSLRGLARLVKIFLETEALPRHSSESSIRFPLWVDTLRDSVVNDISGGIQLSMGLGGYDELGVNVLVPGAYGEASTSGFPWYFGSEDYFPISRLSRGDAWSDIVHAGEDIAVEDIPNNLLDAWDFGKRSREYLNAGMNKDDLDHIYYEHAYGKADDGSQH